VRTVLVPALCYDVGPRIWWPSKLSRHEEDRAPRPAEAEAGP
jgi:RND superfamily putative drug exporter